MKGLSSSVQVSLNVLDWTIVFAWLFHAKTLQVEPIHHILGIHFTQMLGSKYKCLIIIFNIVSVLHKGK